MDDVEAVLIEGLKQRAAVLEASQQYQAAEAVLRKAREHAESKYGKEHQRTLLILTNLAHALVRQDKTSEEAIQLYNKALEGFGRNGLSETDGLVLSTRNNLAASLEYGGNYLEAKRQYERVLDVMKLLPGSDGEVRRQMAILRVNLAHVQSQL
jgi:tetratricopeptide (TPR) repeat protein